MDATNTLTDNAQDIACLMQNDNSDRLFISFLQGYNIAILRQGDNEDLECPCLSDTYWMQVWDFSVSDGNWKGIPNAAETALVGEYSTSDWRNKTTNPPNSASVYIWRNFDNAYVIKACGMDVTVDGHTAQGGDFYDCGGRTEFERVGSTALTGSTSFAANNSNHLREFRDLAETVASKSYYVRIGNVGAPTGTNYSRINKIVIYGLPNGANKPAGSVWVSSIPASPASLFP